MATYRLYTVRRQFAPGDQRQSSFALHEHKKIDVLDGHKKYMFSKVQDYASDGSDTPLCTCCFRSKRSHGSRDRLGKELTGTGLPALRT